MNSSTTQPFFFVRYEGRFVKITFAEILYVEACKNYVKIYTTGRFYLVLATLKQIEVALPATDFCRVHRSFLISLSHLTSFTRSDAQVADRTIPIGENYSCALDSRITIVADTTTSLSKVAQAAEEINA